MGDELNEMVLRYTNTATELALTFTGFLVDRRT